MGKYGANANSGGWYFFTNVESTSGSKLGNVNGDVKTNGFDLTALRNYLEDEDEYPVGDEEAADVNSDGNINGFDLTALRNILEK